MISDILYLDVLFHSVTDADSFESVPEVFFFYSLFDGPVVPDLEGLPPTPHVSFVRITSQAT